MATGFEDDIQRFLGRQGAQGGEFWSGPDGSVAKGGPFSTLEAPLILVDLGLDPATPELAGAAQVLWRRWRPDGRVATAGSGAIYPCQTGAAARTLCRLGQGLDPRMEATLEHLLAIQHPDGGWRCNASKYGHGPETASSNPGPTLTILDAFRFTPRVNTDPRLDRAVEFLLGHWESRLPLGPCHHGIGTLFLKVEYPMLRYNLLAYLHTLSFYRAAWKDHRFRNALAVLEAKLVDGQVVVENPHHALRDFAFCRQGAPSALATERLGEIRRNLRQEP